MRGRKRHIVGDGQALSLTDWVCRHIGGDGGDRQDEVGGDEGVGGQVHRGAVRVQLRVVPVHVVVALRVLQKGEAHS